MLLTICSTFAYTFDRSDTMKTFELPNIEEEQTTLKTIRMKLSTLKKINSLSKKTNISVNRLMNECIEFALNHLTEDDLESKK